MNKELAIMVRKMAKKPFDYTLLMHQTYVVLDIETTGLSPQVGGRMIEIGAIKIKDGEIVEEFSTFINPRMKIPKKITEITSITDEMVADAPVLGRVLPAFHAFIGNAVVVAHNAAFDWNRFLHPAFAYVGLEKSNLVLDTQVLSKLHTPTKGAKHNLATLTQRLGITIANHHRAIDDARATALAFMKLKEHLLAEQGGLLEMLTIPEEAVNPEAPAVIKVSEVNYWEKLVGKKQQYQRHYVSMSYNRQYVSAFFDIPTKCWYIKEAGCAVDIQQVEQAVLNFLELSSSDELVAYRHDAPIR